MLSYEKSGGVTAGGMLDKQHMTNAAVAIGAGFVSVAAVSERAAIRSIATHARNKSQSKQALHIILDLSCVWKIYPIALLSSLMHF